MREDVDTIENRPLDSKRSCKATLALVLVVLVAAAISPAKCASSGAQTLPGLGVVVTQQDSTCFSIDRARLPRGQPVSVVVLGPVPTIVSAEIAGPGTHCSKEPSFNSYALRARSGTLPDIAVEIGVLAPISSLKLHDGAASFALAGQTPLLFRSCTSADGFHVTAWHRYVQLNQDLQQTCSDKETQDVGGKNG